MKIQRSNYSQPFQAKYSSGEQRIYMDAAMKASTESSCLRKNTGAIVVSPQGEIIGTGRSSTPLGIMSCKTIKKGCLRDYFNAASGQNYETCLNVHAEENAILMAGLRRTKGSALFLWGHSFLCNNCAIRTVNAGIEDIYIQLNKEHPITHLSADNLKNIINEAFIAGLENLAKKVGKPSLF